MAAVAAAVLSVAAAGCGRRTADARAGDPRAEIRRVHHAWLERLASACFYAVGRFAGSLTEEERAAFSRVRVRRVRVRGARAEIDDRDLVVPPELDGLSGVNGVPMVLRRVSGNWRIDEIA